MLSEWREVSQGVVDRDCARGLHCHPVWSLALPPLPMPRSPLWAPPWGPQVPAREQALVMSTPTSNQPPFYPKSAPRERRSNDVLNVSMAISRTMPWIS